MEIEMKTLSIAIVSAAALSLTSPAALADGKDHHESMHGMMHGKSEGGRADHDGAVGKPGNPDNVSRSVEVTMSDNMRFTPSKINVKRGETVRFVVKNTGQTRHEMVIGSMAELKEHAEMMRRMPGMEHADGNQVSVDPGKVGELVWQFTKAGRFDFACLQPGHFEAGMAGRVIVRQEVMR